MTAKEKVEEALSHYPHFRILDGIWGAVQIMTYGKGRIITGDFNELSGYEHGYCYSTYEQACYFLDRWANANGAGEPEGWFRCVTDGRRRPNGDPSLEYVQH